jgi:hypothetical protein
MPLHKQSLDPLLVLSGMQLHVPPSAIDIRRRIQICLSIVATDYSAKRLLIRTIRPIWIMTFWALARRKPRRAESVVRRLGL